MNNPGHSANHHDAFADDADVHESAKIQVRRILRIIALKSNYFESSLGRLLESQVSNLLRLIVARCSFGSSSFIDGKKQMYGILGET